MIWSVGSVALALAEIPSTCNDQAALLSVYCNHHHDDDHDDDDDDDDD